MELMLVTLHEWQFVFITLVVGLLIAAFIYLIRSKATMRHEPNVVQADPPIRKPGDPAFIKRRSSAAAAAMILHRRRHIKGELNENR